MKNTLFVFQVKFQLLFREKTRNNKYITIYRTINEPQSTNDKLVENVLKENSLNFLNSTINNVSKKELMKTKLKIMDETSFVNSNQNSHFKQLNINTNITKPISEHNIFSFGKTGFAYKPVSKGFWLRGKIIVTNNTQEFKYYLETNNTLILTAKKHSRNDYQIYNDESFIYPLSKVTNNFLGNQYTVQNIFPFNKAHCNNNTGNNQILCKIKYVSYIYNICYRI